MDDQIVFSTVAVATRTLRGDATRPFKATTANSLHVVENSVLVLGVADSDFWSAPSEIA
ncbi:MAG: hypothetical protein ABSG43_01890 [Solirubrobacteraceae bacterium]